MRIGDHAWERLSAGQGTWFRVANEALVKMLLDTLGVRLEKKPAVML